MKENVHFIDCGANQGLAIDWAREKFKKRLTRVDAFEPEILNYHKILDTFIDEKLDFEFCLHLNAVWVREEIRDFFIQHWGSRTGSSLLQEKEHRAFTGQSWPNGYLGTVMPTSLPEGALKFDQSTQTCVFEKDILFSEVVRMPAQCIDLSKWIKINTEKENYNVLKIDIEGAEYKVVEHLLETEADKHIDEWHIEFTADEKLPEESLIYNHEVVDRFKSTVSNFHHW